MCHECGFVHAIEERQSEGEAQQEGRGLPLVSLLQSAGLAAELKKWVTLNFPSSSVCWYNRL